MPLTRLPLTTGVSGTLAAGNGGTGVTSADEIGNMVLLSTATASNDASIDFDNTLITDTYSFYRLIGREVKQAIETGANLFISVDNGSNFLNGKRNSRFNHSSHSDNTNASRHSSSSNSLTAGYNIGNASGENGNFELDFYNLRSSLNKHVYTKMSYTSSSGTTVWISGNLEFYNTSKANYIKYSPTGGNITSGKFSLYGVRT